MIKSLVLILSLFLAFSLEAKDEGLLSKLFSPGPLIEGHKDLETNKCLSCHSAGSGIDSNKCLECHKEIRKDVLAKKSFHGITSQSCIKCHADHRGRTFNPISFDIKSFDHNTTGYRLSGKHSKIKCTECHTRRRTKKVIRQNETQWHGQQGNCRSCHAKHDVHYFKGKFKDKDCNACHKLKSWKTKVTFDHFETSRYKLQGKHEEISCKKCHVPTAKKSQYKWPELKKNQCKTCHKDYHGTHLSKKNRGGDCQKCHEQKTWKIAKFDHAVTGYPLRDSHKNQKCTNCHQPKYQKVTVKKLFGKGHQWQGLKQQCLSCHKDFHEYKNHKMTMFKDLNNCLNCHNEKKWNSIHNFSHNRDTQFPITGKHAGLKCIKCHKRSRPNRVGKIYHWNKLSTKTCETCHKSPHYGKFSKKFLQKKCTECHSPMGWKIKNVKFQKNFNHSQTRFGKLDGKHKNIQCSSCHTVNGQQIFKFKSDKKGFCIDCHRTPHQNQFKQKFNDQSCKKCHLTTTFKKLKTFNHNMTGFPLKGTHAKTRCFDCHRPYKKGTYNKKSKIWHKFQFPEIKEKHCLSCHKDYHRGQLQSDCSKCHQETRWKRIHFNHNKDSSFALKGKHQKVKCYKCHKGIKRIRYNKKKHILRKYKPMDSNCISCHQKNDKHKGEFGQKCQSCHSEKTWKKSRDFHKNFTLSGVHYNLQCDECHKDNRSLGGMSDNCFLCHQKDDVHNGNLPNCNECHRQNFWEFTSFRHSLTNFPLRGSHRVLDCFQCHANGVYEGTPNNCIDCHLRDAQAVTSPNHNLGGFTNCNSCHNQFLFDLGL